MTRVPGRKLRLPEGYEAFVPAPLPPPDLAWTPRVVNALSAADRGIGQLAGEGRRLPNPHLLIRPFVRREAVLSSRIEGTQATLGELLAAEAGVGGKRVPPDLREVTNYVTALEYGIERLDTLPLSLRLIREMHERLMRNVRGDRATPGEFRRSQNWIGPPGATLANATYVPPPPTEMMEALGAWEQFIHETTLPPLVHIALAHYQFEAIHPFLDGNGRVGRLLISLFLAERSLLPAPLLCLSAFFEATRRDYYERLRSVSERGEWEAWLEYFLLGVARQAEDALSRAERLNSCLARWHQQVTGTASGASVALIDLLAENPYWTIKRVAERLDVAYSTAHRAVERLTALSILTEITHGKRGRVYCAQEILDILEEPPRMS